MSLAGQVDALATRIATEIKAIRAEMRGTANTASTATLTVDSDTVRHYAVTALAANLTIANPTGTPTDGRRLLIRLKDNATPRTLTWGSAFRAIGVTLPATTVASKTHYIGCVWNAADSKWDVLAVSAEA